MRTFVVSLIAALVLSAGGYGLYVTTADSTASSQSSSDTVRPVNAVLENESFRATFGTAPSSTTPERLRLRTHLAYVEALLRSRRRPSLSPAQQTRRSKMLDALHRYWRTGRFPQNTEVAGRAPIFIDAHGRLCAVGHLIAVSAGRQVAERIDSRYHFADVREMEMPVLDRWATRHGFTRRELAMIQPMYDGCCVVGPAPEEKKPSAIEISALSASVGATMVNGVLLEQDSPSLVGGTVGMVSGGTSLAVGLGDDVSYPIASSVAGIASMVLGGWSFVAGLRKLGSDESPTAAPSATANAQSWSIAPATVTTRPGTTRPGVRATIQF